MCPPSIDRHRKPVSDAIVYDNSLRFSARIFIRMMVWIMQTGLANGLPIAGKKQAVVILL
jgi:hypothetical protein